MDDMKKQARLQALREAIEMMDEMEVDGLRPKPPMGAPPEAPPEMEAEAAEGEELPIPEGEDLESLKAKLLALCE